MGFPPASVGGFYLGAIAITEVVASIAIAVHQGIPLQRLERVPTLSHSHAAMVLFMADTWQQQRWHQGTWRRVGRKLV
jgi:hypothetical protein